MWLEYLFDWKLERGAIGAIYVGSVSDSFDDEKEAEGLKDVVEGAKEVEGPNEAEGTKEVESGAFK